MSGSTAGAQSKNEQAPLTVEVSAGPILLGVPFDVTATATATSSMPGVVFRTESKSAGLSVDATERTVDLLAATPHAETFAFTLVEYGTHLLRVYVTQTNPDGSRDGASRQAFVVAEPGLPAEFHVDQLPISTVKPAAEEIGNEPALVPEVPLPGAPEAPEGLAPPLPMDPVPSRPLDVDSELLEDPLGTLGLGDDGVGVQSHSTFVVHVCFGFYDHADVFRAQRWVYVKVMDADSPDSDDQLWSGLTGNDGCVTTGAITRADDGCCGAGNQDVYIVFEACTGAICVTDSGGTVYDGFTPTQTVGTEDTMERGWWGPPTSERFAWRPYQYGHNAWSYATTWGFSSSELGQAYIRIPSTQCSGACQSGVNIYLYADGEDDRSPDTVGHEYGHFVQERVYSGYEPSNFDDHGFCDLTQHRGLAWSEGWADYFGVMADHRSSGIPGATGDTFYNVPADGSVSSWNIEYHICSGTLPTGDSNEWNIATSLWDLYDAVNDGYDTVSDSDVPMNWHLAACNDFSYNDVYNGGGAGANSPSCNYYDPGDFVCNFVKSAFQNRINFNRRATATVTSQPSFTWVRGTITLTATGSELDCNIDPMQFRVSTNNICSDSDTLAGSDPSSPYSTTFNTAVLANDSSVWTCARAYDELEWGDYDISSSSIGIDNSAPTPTASRSCFVSGNSGWCRGSSASVTLTVSDSFSGLSSSSCVWDGSPISCGTFTASFQGTKVGSASGTDLAGNTASASVTVRIDGSAPSASVTVPSIGAVSYTVSWSASDFVSGLTGTLQVEERNVLLGGTVVACSQGLSAGQTSTSGSCTRGSTAPLLPGQYCYRIVVSDVAGNTGTSGESCITKV